MGVAWASTQPAEKAKQLGAGQGGAGKESTGFPELQLCHYP